MPQSDINEEISTAFRPDAVNPTNSVKAAFNRSASALAFGKAIPRPAARSSLEEKE
jgi:hypothetical protein